MVMGESFWGLSEFSEGMSIQWGTIYREPHKGVSSSYPFPLSSAMDCCWWGLVV